MFAARQPENIVNVEETPVTTTASLTGKSRDVATRMYAAIARADFEQALSYFSENVVVNEPAFLPYGGVYRGIDGVRTAFDKISLFLDVINLSVEQLIADGDRVVAIVSIPEHVSGRRILLAEESLCCDGKISEIRVYFHKAQGLLLPCLPLGIPGGSE
jgi:ketosteroid isomerase-like protein